MDQIKETFIEELKKVAEEEGTIYTLEAHGTAEDFVWCVADYTLLDVKNDECIVRRGMTIPIDEVFLDENEAYDALKYMD